MPRALALLPILALLIGCADNSGGPPPEGTELEEFTPVVFDPGGLFCGVFADDAFLLRDRGEAELFLADDCPNNDVDVEQALLAVVEDLEEGEALVVLTVQLGGCVGDWGVHGFYLSEDETTVTGWVLRGDTSYGRQQVACPADIGEAVAPYRVLGVGSATGADIHVGTYNPDLPGAPAQPG